MAGHKLFVSDSIVSFVARSISHPPSPRRDPRLDGPVQQWCDDNLEHPIEFGGTQFDRPYNGLAIVGLFYTVTIYHVSFGSLNDLLLFKLRWGEDVL